MEISVRDKLKELRNRSLKRRKDNNFAKEPSNEYLEELRENYKLVLSSWIVGNKDE